MRVRDSFLGRLILGSAFLLIVFGLLLGAPHLAIAISFALLFISSATFIVQRFIWSEGRGVDVLDFVPEAVALVVGALGIIFTISLHPLTLGEVVAVGISSAFIGIFGPTRALRMGMRFL